MTLERPLRAYLEEVCLDRNETIEATRRYATYGLYPALRGNLHIVDVLKEFSRRPHESH